MVGDTTPSRIRIAFPRGAELARLVAHFGAAGFEVDALLDDPGPLDAGDPIDSGFDFEFVTLSPIDVGTYVEYGICHVGVMSTDLIRENGVNVWRPFTFNFGSYPLVLSAMRGHTLETLTSKPVLRPATPLVGFTKEWFTRRGISTEVISVTDNAATAVVLGLADCWVDRLTDPDQIVDQGFRVVESMGQTYLKLVVNPAAASRRRAAIQVLIKALESHLPPEPEPVEVPFDLEDPL